MSRRRSEITSVAAENSCYQNGTLMFNALFLFPILEEFRDRNLRLLRFDVLLRNAGTMAQTTQTWSPIWIGLKQSSASWMAISYVNWSLTRLLSR